MKKKFQRLSALALLLGFAAPAQAAPVLMAVELRVTIPGIATLQFNDVGNVDVSGGTYAVPAGIVAQTAALTIPLTATTAIDSLQALGVANLAGSLSVGGATAQAPGEVCIAPGPAEACVVGGGLGGALGLTGIANVRVIPSILSIPVDLATLLFGLGGSVASAFSADAAVWTTRTALANTGTSVFSTQGGITSGGAITLVSATYVNCCGNTLSVFTRLTLTPVVPEPSTWILLALGAGGLLALRRG